MTEAPPLPPEVPFISADNEAEVPAYPAMEQRADGSLVIDLLVPPPPSQDCGSDEPDPFNPEIVVCEASGPSPRIGPMIGPEDDPFGSAIPRARIKLSETTSAEANATAPSVGDWNAQGGEVKLKIDF